MTQSPTPHHCQQAISITSGWLQGELIALGQPGRRRQGPGWCWHRSLRCRLGPVTYHWERRRFFVDLVEKVHDSGADFFVALPAAQESSDKVHDLRCRGPAHQDFDDFDDGRPGQERVQFEAVHGVGINRGYSTSMADIPNPNSMITGANLPGYKPTRPGDEDLASLLGEVLANEARHQGKPAPSTEQVEGLLGLMLSRPGDVLETQTQEKTPAPGRSRPRRQGRTRRSGKR
jgi:hypothetical protein